MQKQDVILHTTYRKRRKPHLKHRNDARLREVQNGLDITRDRVSGGDFDLLVEHYHDVLQLGVVDDVVRAMAARAPQRDEVSEPFVRVRHTGRERLDELDFGRVGRLTGVAVPPEVPSGVLIICAVDELRRVPVRRLINNTNREGGKIRLTPCSERDGR